MVRQGAGLRLTTDSMNTNADLIVGFSRWFFAGDVFESSYGIWTSHLLSLRRERHAETSPRRRFEVRRRDSTP